MQTTEPVNLLLILATDFIFIIGRSLVRLCELRVGLVSLSGLWRGLWPELGGGLAYHTRLHHFGCFGGEIFGWYLGDLSILLCLGSCFCPRCGLVGLRV